MKEDDRIYFRATDQQKLRIDELMKNGLYKTKSELIRRLVNIGLDTLEAEK